jgi:uncharacterized small protein (DUF1192 family)
MLDDDPFAPPIKKTASLEQQLENASIGELEHRIEKLREEISLCDHIKAGPARGGGLGLWRASSVAEPVLAEHGPPLASHKGL